jgi:hypothetical protein
LLYQLDFTINTQYQQVLRKLAKYRYSRSRNQSLTQR